MASQPLSSSPTMSPGSRSSSPIALAEEGFKVITAANGEEALRKAEEYRPDVVLLDIVMPDLDGIEVMRQLREGRPVPVILLTAKGSTADKAKGLDLGADDYVANRSTPMSSRPASAPSSAAAVARRRGRGSSASTTSRSTSSAGWCSATASSSSCRGPSGCSSSTWRERRQGRPPHGAADEGVGPGVPRRPPVPARLDQPRPAQAGGAARRARPDQTFQGIGYLPTSRTPSPRTRAPPSDRAGRMQPEPASGEPDQPARGRPCRPSDGPVSAASRGATEPTTRIALATIVSAAPPASGRRPVTIAG